MRQFGDSEEVLVPVLQTRWQLHDSNEGTRLIYFGLRNYPLHNRRIIPISRKTADLIKRFDGKRKLSEIVDDTRSGTETKNEELDGLIQEKVIIDRSRLRRQPTAHNHQTCIKCVNNDYILPGLEFNDEGLCAFCQCYEHIKDDQAAYFIGGNTISEAELLDVKQKNDAAFDVLVLYTGGKDSSFLLWYLAKKLGLRVLSCTWDMPFTHETAWNNMKTAQRKLPEVEWLVRTVSWDAMNAALHEMVKRFALPCICPFIAYGLFYPVAVQEKIPLIMDGIEASQTNMAKALSFSLDLGRQALSNRQRSLIFLKSLTEPNLSNHLSYMEEFTETVRKSLAPSFEPLKRMLAETKEEALPAIKRLKSEEVYESWKDVAEIIKKELDWQMPPNQSGLLHTSCKIETVKDYVQYKGFQMMKTQMFPQSILEISSAIYFGHIDREEGFRELAERGYGHAPQAFRDLIEKLDLKAEDVMEMDASIRFIFTDEDLVALNNQTERKVVKRNEKKA